MDSTNISYNPSATRDPFDDCASVGFCQIQFPSSLTIESGESANIYGRVYVDGCTDGGAECVGVQAEAGFGDPSVDPSASPSSYTWASASYNAGHTSDNNDEYDASITAPAVGSYAYGYRFSVDSGATWTYCDLNGGNDVGNGGISVAELGPMDVVLNGCTDSGATNYDSSATNDDGTCAYDVTFSVDMRCSGLDTSSGVEIRSNASDGEPAGSSAFGSMGALVESPAGIWTATIQFGGGDWEWKAKVTGDSGTGWEDLIPNRSITAAAGAQARPSFTTTSAEAPAPLAARTAPTPSTTPPRTSMMAPARRSPP